MDFVDLLTQLPFYANIGSVLGFLITIWAAVTQLRTRRRYLLLLRGPDLLDELREYGGEINRYEELSGKKQENRFGEVSFDSNEFVRARRLVDVVDSRSASMGAMVGMEPGNRGGRRRNLCPGSTDAQCSQQLDPQTEGGTGMSFTSRYPTTRKQLDVVLNLNRLTKEEGIEWERSGSNEEDGRGRSTPVYEAEWKGHRVQILYGDPPFQKEAVRVEEEPEPYWIRVHDASGNRIVMIPPMPAVEDLIDTIERKAGLDTREVNDPEALDSFNRLLEEEL